MGKTIKLASVLLKCSLGSGKTDDTHKVSAKKILNTLMIIALVPVVYFLFNLGVKGQELFSVLEGEEIILQTSLFLASLIICVAGIFSCINTFYLSSNLECLLVMPFSSTQITGAKFIVAAFYEYYISLVVVAPLLVGFGYAGHASLYFWIGTAVTVLLLPLLPLAYSAVISMLIMRVFGSARNKQRMAALSAFGVVFFGMAFSMISNYVQHMHKANLEQTMEHMMALAKDIMWLFPDVPFFVNVMHNQDILSLVWAVLAIVAAIVIFLIAARFLYLAGALGMQDTSSAHKVLGASTIEKMSKQKNIVTSCTIRELKSLFRTPAYYVSSLIISLGWPFVVLIPMIVQAVTTSSASGITKDMLRSIVDQISKPGTLFTTLFWLILLVNSFCTVCNSIAHSAISREGQGFFYMKILPISYKDQLKAKRNAALIICGISGCVYISLIVLYLIIAEGLPLWALPVTIILSACIVLILVDLQMLFGLMKPRLNWDTEADAVKNPASFFLFVVMLFSCGEAMIFGWNPLDFLSLSPWILMLIVCVILMVLAFIIDRILYAYGVRKLERM